MLARLSGDPSEMGLSSPLPVANSEGDRLEPRPGMDSALPSAGDSQADNEVKPQRPISERLEQLESMAKIIQERRPGSNMFLNNTANGRVKQRMGKSLFVGDGAGTPGSQEASKPADTYYGCKATNGAKQYLGDEESFPTFAAKKEYGSQTVFIADCEVSSDPVGKSGREKSGTSQQCGPTIWVGNVKRTSDQ